MFIRDVVILLQILLMTSSCGIYSLSDGSGCFSAGTKILTPEGPRPIESLKSGQSVFSWDKDTNEVVIGIVDALITHEETTPWTIVLSNGTSLHVTPDHPLYLKETHRWVPVSELNPGDTLASFDHTTKQLGTLSIASLQIGDTKERTYNIKVRQYENSFAEGLLAHFY